MLESCLLILNRRGKARKRPGSGLSFCDAGETSQLHLCSCWEKGFNALFTFLFPNGELGLWSIGQRFWFAGLQPKSETLICKS
jgi:hypothetical protein